MTDRKWLIVDASPAGAMRFCEVIPSDTPLLGRVHSIRTEGLATFTDALQRFASETSNRLGDFEPLIAIAGAASGDRITLARSNWTITRAGLSSLFGTRVRIVNDVVAMAWGAQALNARLSSIRGGRARPDWTQPGRLAMLFVGDGVGAAIVDVDRDDARRVMETESGHLDFAPVSERELKIAEARRDAHQQASWEQMVTIDAHDPLWKDFSELRDTDRARLAGEWLGRLSVNLLHAHGAWDGLLLTGPRAGALTSGSARIAFDGAFTRRRTFQRLVSQVPVWTVEQSEAVLNGGAALMAVRTREGVTP